MKNYLFFILGVLVLVVGTGLVLLPSTEVPYDQPDSAITYPDDTMQICHLSSGDTTGFEKIRRAFAERNAGYDLAYFSRQMQMADRDFHRILFVQEGGGTITIGKAASKFSVGDIIFLDPGESLEADSLFSVLAFRVPEVRDPEVPRFIRPDWDMNITDVPGGCATETGAYRRILLTWLGKVGPYLYHSLNAHRVRIMDSFTHYHPKEGGFDEFYLVQMAMPHARIITSSQVPLIEQPEKVLATDAGGLLQETPLKAGDLVYLPRGVAHRGIDGVLAQVITVPGFIPGSEIGLDHHLRKINELLGLEGEAALPYNESASLEAIVK